MKTCKDCECIARSKNRYFDCCKKKYVNEITFSCDKHECDLDNFKKCPDFEQRAKIIGLKFRYKPSQLLMCLLIFVIICTVIGGGVGLAFNEMSEDRGACIGALIGFFLGVITGFIKFIEEDTSIENKYKNEVSA